MLFEAFRDVAQRHAERPAASDVSRCVTYAGLLQWATSLAASFRKQWNLCEGRRAAIVCSPGVGRIAATLAVSACRAAYVPIAREQPAARRAQIFASSGAACLIGDAQTSWGAADAPAVSTASRQDHEAYLIYTSGSTGTAKGVTIMASSVVAMAANRHGLAIRQDDVVLNGSNFGFDVSTYEIWATLLAGAHVVTPPNGELVDIERLRRRLHEARVNVLFLPSRVFDQHYDYDPGLFGQLRALLVGGEAVDAVRLRRLARSPERPECILNAYGPTEATAFATFHRVDAVHDGPVPIGTALDGVRCVVLDATGRCQAQQTCTGELGLCGAHLAAGYVNDAAATASAFPTLQTPWGPQRVYRTKDCVRRREDGELLYLGRLDDQYNVDGVRTDPHEVANVLREYGSFSHAVVIPVDVEGRCSPAAAIVPTSALRRRLGNHATIIRYARAILHDHLPKAMCPRYFQVWERLPVQPNGKTDRAEIVRVLTDRVRVDAISSGDGLFDFIANFIGSRLGDGAPELTPQTAVAKLALDSIDTLQLIARLCQTFGANLSVGALQRCQDLAALCALVRAQKDEQRDSHVKRISYVPGMNGVVAQLPVLAYLPTHLAKLAEHDDTSLRPLNEMVAGMTVLGHFDPDLWHHSVEGVWARHTGLRLDIGSDGFGCTARCCVVVGTQAGGARPARRHRHLLKGPLLETFIVPIAPEVTEVYLCFHHILLDLVSIAVVQQDLLDLYCGALARRVAAPAATPQYDEFVVCEKQRIAQASYELSLKEAGALHGDKQRCLPIAAVAGPARRAAVAHDAYISPHLMQALLRRARAYRCTPFTLLATLFGHCLQDVFAAPDVGFGVIDARRTNARHAAMVGLMRDYRLLVPPRCATLGDSCAATAQQMQMAPHYHYDLVRHLGPRSADHTALFNVLFDYQSNTDAKQVPSVHETHRAVRCVRRWMDASPGIHRDLSCRVTGAAGGAQLRLRYRHGAVASAMAARLCSDYLKRLGATAC